MKGLTIGHKLWTKLKTMYESTTTANQVHDLKSASKHISKFSGVLNQLQDAGLQIFDDKMKAIFLPMTLPET